jgi:hypothetical protein
MTYGESVSWCIRHSAVFRFVPRNARQQFVAMNESVSGDKSIEVAYTREDGRTVAVHAPLDSSTEPSKAVARALIGCVEFLAQQRSAVITGAGVN